SESVANARDLDAAIAVTRFGLGARPGEIAQAARDPRGFLKAQIRREGAEVPEGDGETSAQRYAEFVGYRRDRLMNAGKAGANARFAPPRGAPQGLNENLAREILELHTVGVGGGYTQGDVTEFARALTGLTIARPDERGLAGEAVFREAAHEPGHRTVMGVRY